MSEMRVQAANEDVVRLVERDGVDVAGLHGQADPDVGADGSEILTNVPVPGDAAIITGAPRQEVIVQGRHRRAGGWKYDRHRVVTVDAVERDVIWASEWSDGAWPGDSTLKRL